jgi:hypothetical protein
VAPRFAGANGSSGPEDGDGRLLFAWSPVGLRLACVHRPYESLTHSNMSSRRPTIQSLISARNETDDSADERHRRFQQDEQKYQHVNPQQLTRPVMNDDGESKVRGPEDGGNGHGKGESNKGPKRGARACTNCEYGVDQSGMQKASRQNRQDTRRIIREELQAGDCCRHTELWLIPL